MGFKKLTSLVLASCIPLFGARALAQESIDPSGIRLSDKILEVQTLDDSIPTWHKLLDVDDTKERGYEASFGLKKNKFTVSSDKSEGFVGKTFERNDVRYCIIDRDPGVRNIKCDIFPDKGKVKLSLDYANGAFAFFLEVPTSKEGEYARLDEYHRLSKAPGTLKLNRKKADTDDASKGKKGKSKETVTFGDDEVVEGKAKPKRGAVDKEKRLKTRTDLAVKKAAEELTRRELLPTPFSASGRLIFEPFSNQNNTLPNTEPRIGTQGFGLDAAAGYSGENFGIGGFGSFYTKGLEFDEVGSGVALGTGNDLKHVLAGLSVRADTYKGRRGQLNLRVSPGSILMHRLNYGIGSDIHFNEETKEFSYIVDLSLVMPKLFLNKDDGSLGIADELSHESLGGLTQEQEGSNRSVNYGRKDSFTNRLMSVVGVRDPAEVYLAAGWQHSRVSSLRLRENLSSEDLMRLSSDGNVDLGSLTRRDLTGNGVLVRLSHYPENWIYNTGYGFNVNATTGQKFNRVGLGFFVGGSNVFFAYDYTLDRLDLGNGMDAKDNRHMITFEAGIDLERSLLPPRRILPSHTLR